MEEKIRDWNGKEVVATRSGDGVLVLADPFDNLVSTGIRPWPPAEIVQKLYKSGREWAFPAPSRSVVTAKLGYHCDLQSIHSEDALTWSVFGTVARAAEARRNRWVQDFLSLLGIQADAVTHSEIFLWRRVPHPDTLVSGGPEIDFGIQTESVVLLGEAKWRSPLAKEQGERKNKDQVQLRVEFLRKLGSLFFSAAERKLVAAIGWRPDLIPTQDDGDVFSTSSTWDAVCRIASHPLAQELQAYLDWKKAHSHEPP